MTAPPYPSQNTQMGFIPMPMHPPNLQASIDSAINKLGDVVSPSAPPQFMVPPKNAIPDCPQGLECLSIMNSILVKQEVNTIEVVSCWEQNNKYEIFNELGQKAFNAIENTNACARQCCRTQRGFEIFFSDNRKINVMKITRPYRCCAGSSRSCFASMCDCCAHEVIIEVPSTYGSEQMITLGYVKQRCGVFRSKYYIMDERKEPILKLDGPAPCCICDGIFGLCSTEFKLRNITTNSEIGKIVKKFNGLKEAFTTADNFGVEFYNRELPVKTKAIVLGAVFLIDFMFFETKNTNLQYKGLSGAF